PLKEDRALTMGIQIAEALVEAHAHGVQHRDLKPANIMLTPEGEAKVLDFGVAKLTDLDTTTLTHGLTQSGALVGILAYMALEVLCGEATDARTDVYGLGLILYETVTGRRPFPDDMPHELMFTIMNQPPPDPQVLNAKLSARARAIILKAIEKA